MHAYNILEGSGKHAASLSDGFIYNNPAIGQHVFSGRFEDFVDDFRASTPDGTPDKIDGFIFDAPGVDDGMSVHDLVTWARDLFDRINSIAHKNAALILLPTNRRGGAFFKSSILETMAQLSGWHACREIIWDQGSDFLRTKYPFRKFTVFRRGDKSMQSDSPMRYKDILRARSEREKESEYAPVPESILAELLTLFKFNLICDPFAGTGSLAKASLALGIPCISCELDPEAALAIVDTIIGRLA